MAEHVNAPFSEMHRAKFGGGVLASRPASPEGKGDAYLATDTHELYVCYGDLPLSWVLFSGGGGGGGLGYIGTKRICNFDVVIPGDDSSTYFDWPLVLWSIGAPDFGTGSGFLQPDIGIYSFSINLFLENTTAARWRLEVWYDGGDSTSELVNFHTDGGGDDAILHITSQFQALKDADGGGYFYLYLYQDSGVDQSVKTYSSMTFQRIGDPP